MCMNMGASMQIFNTEVFCISDLSRACPAFVAIYTHVTLVKLSIYHFLFNDIKLKGSTKGHLKGMLIHQVSHSSWILGHVNYTGSPQDESHIHSYSIPEASLLEWLQRHFCYPKQWL